VSRPRKSRRTTRHLVQVLVPLQDADGAAYPRELYDELSRQLTERFGGVTAYTRAPATGLWKAPSGRKVKDQVVVYEVMVERLERAWWAKFRRALEAKLQQQELVIRAQAIVRL
jgi:hypothetical protein